MYCVKFPFFYLCSNLSCFLNLGCQVVVSYFSCVNVLSFTGYFMVFPSIVIFILCMFYPFAFLLVAASMAPLFIHFIFRTNYITCIL